MSLENGPKALELYNTQNGSRKSQNMNESANLLSPDTSSRKRTRRKISYDNFVNSADINLESEEDSEDFLGPTTKKNQLNKSDFSLRSQGIYKNTRSSSKKNNSLLSNTKYYDESSSDENKTPTKRLRIPSSRKKISGPQTPSSLPYEETSRSIVLKKTPSAVKRFDVESDELGYEETKSEYSESFVRHRHKTRSKSFHGQSRKPNTRTRRLSRRNQTFEISESSEGSLSPVHFSSPARPSRRSFRQKVTKNMKEQDEEDIYADDDPQPAHHKALNIREIFKPIPHHNLFRKYHNVNCDVCDRNDKTSKRGSTDLIFCQGCSTSIHQICLGTRTSRDHIVTKIGPDSFVMQCRRCVGTATKKDETAPRLDVCQVCRKTGPSCMAFSTKKTARQDEIIRLNNGGEDPITEVSNELINNADNVLFRCIGCQRAFHFEHLPSYNIHSSNPSDIEMLRKSRLHEYCLDWRCQDCRKAPSRVQGLVCWRPLNSEKYIHGQKADEVNEDEKEYLIKWSNKSYFDCSWMPGSWVWGATMTVMRKAFLRRDDGLNMLPRWTSEEAIPEEYFQIEIVFDVNYNKDFAPKSEKNDKSAIDMIIEVFVKFKGLPYDEAVWVKPPSSEDTDRYKLFEAAYNDYVSGQYFKQSSASVMNQRLEAFRKRKFAKHLELKQQPPQLTGGKMMPYQMEGLNWLLYNFHQKKNVILADEMGLGKTIQIISLFAALAKGGPRCWPFLVVTPNSTCPNWRREIKKWAPSLRVVSYYGTKAARDMAMDFEMYPQGCSDLRAHIVITSFEAPTNEHCKAWFNRINWAGLVVDEGQRLKNDGNLLYIALRAFKAPFRVLLTGK